MVGGGSAADPAPETKVGLVGWAGWAIACNPRNSFTNTVTNHPAKLRQRAHPIGANP
jgi:hypothetical protein